MAENEYRIYTRLELLTNLRNETQDKIVRYEVNLEYFSLKAKLFPKKDPIRVETEARLKQTQDSLRFDRILLMVIDQHIKEEKQNKPKGNN